MLAEPRISTIGSEDAVTAITEQVVAFTVAKDILPFVFVAVALDTHSFAFVVVEESIRSIALVAASLGRAKMIHLPCYSLHLQDVRHRHHLAPRTPSTGTCQFVSALVASH